MSSRTGNSIIVFGTAILILGICGLAAAAGDRADTSLLGISASVFALGALTIAGGIYFKARVLQSELAGRPAAAPVSAARSRGNCDLCRKAMPVIHCKVHQFHLCADCLAEHYDFRSCVYVPSTRRVSGRTLAAHGS